MVDVSGISRDQLLQCLWNNAVVAGFYELDDALPPKFLDLQTTKAKALANKGYVNYASGRTIKAEIYGEHTMIDATLYDSHNGRGKFQECVNVVRAGR
jgi:hypothetical protein